MENTEYKLVWFDDFNDESLNTNVWTYEVDAHRNNELQKYTDKKDNIYLDDSKLVIRALKQKDGDFAYTSADICSFPNMSFLYGYLEVRAKLPYGKGVWPAFWLGGVVGRIDKEQKWPMNGEVDIFELVGGGDGDSTIYANLHWGVRDENGKPVHHFLFGPEYSYMLANKKFSDDYHTFGIEWTEEEFIWYVDRKPFCSQKIVDDEYKCFHSPMFILLNLAIGGDWPGDPNEYTVFPSEYRIDYIRLYQKNGKNNSKLNLKRKNC